MRSGTISVGMGTMAARRAHAKRRARRRVGRNMRETLKNEKLIGQRRVAAVLTWRDRLRGLNRGAAGACLD
jgi:hypothetical protein